MENYIDVLGYEGFYGISNKGNVKRNEKTLKPTLNKKTGYLYISLCKNGIVEKFNIHQLMGICFLGLKPDGTNKKVIDHIDDNKLNNDLCNLRITTNRINCSKTKRGITSKYVGVRKNKGKFESQIRIGKTRKYLGRFVTELEAYNAYKKALNDIN